ncbi:MAG TPA: DUF4349 domain-containing protein [Actinomycetota bacterium]|nr:DUF4349 domain-containing protein [Actinomycetota bacterium]
MTSGRRSWVGAALLLAAAATGCAGADDGAGGGASVRSAEAAPEALRANAHADSAADLPAVGPAVIKTASVEIGVAEGRVQEAVQKAVAIAGAFPGGFVTSSTLDAGADPTGTLVLRVPAADFEEALDRLKELGDVRAQSVSGEDVTQEFVDLQARLRNWEAQEAVLLRLMERAASVTDTIRVQGELGRVQLEIERLRGRLAYLEDQTSLGTITATFVSGAPPSQPPGALARAWERALEAALSVVTAVVVGAGFVVPVAVLVGLGLLVFRTLRPRLT